MSALAILLILGGIVAAVFVGWLAGEDGRLVQAFAVIAVLVIFIGLAYAAENEASNRSPKMPTPIYVIVVTPTPEGKTQ